MDAYGIFEIAGKCRLELELELDGEERRGLRIAAFNSSRTEEREVLLHLLLGVGIR
jgi:hypothetical protein